MMHFERFAGLIGLVAAAILMAACNTTSSARRPDAEAGGQRSLVDITWEGTGSYQADRRRDRQDPNYGYRRYDRSWYESKIQMNNPAAASQAPLQQAVFVEKAANVSPGSASLAGLRSVPAAAPPTANELAEEADFFGRDGSVTRLSSFRGKPLILVFTRGFPGYVCPMCVGYTSQLAARQDEILAMGGRVAVVFPVRSRDRSVVGAFVSACDEVLAESGKEALPYPVLLDLDAKAVDEFGLAAENPEFCRPTTLIFDDEGVLSWGYVGAEPDDRPSVDSVLRELGAISGGGR